MPNSLPPPRRPRLYPVFGGFMIGVTCMLVVLLAGWPWWTGLIAAVVVSFGWALFYLRAQVRWLWQNRHRHGWNQPPHKVEVVETSLVDRRESRGDGTGITSPRIRTPVEETGRVTAVEPGWYEVTGRFTLPEPPSDDPKADPHMICKPCRDGTHIGGGCPAGTRCDCQHRQTTAWGIPSSTDPDNFAPLIDVSSAPFEQLIRSDPDGPLRRAQDRVADAVDGTDEPLSAFQSFITSQEVD